MAANDPVLPCDPPQHARPGGELPLTARASAGPSRGADAPTRTTWTREGVVAILAVLGIALAVRLIIAYAYPGTGLIFDVSSFRAWAADLAQHGLYGIYDRDFFL